MAESNDKALFADLPKPSEMRELARQAGHDSLAIAGDIEAVVTLTNAARRRAMREQTPEAIQAWMELLEESHRLVASGSPIIDTAEDAAPAYWLHRESLAVEVLARRVPGFAEPDWIGSFRTSNAGTLQKVEADEITRQFEFELEKATLKAG